MGGGQRRQRWSPSLYTSADCNAPCDTAPLRPVIPAAVDVAVYFNITTYVSWLKSCGWLIHRVETPMNLFARLQSVAEADQKRGCQHRNRD